MHPTRSRSACSERGAERPPLVFAQVLTRHVEQLDWPCRGVVCMLAVRAVCADISACALSPPAAHRPTPPWHRLSPLSRRPRALQVTPAPCRLPGHLQWMVSQSHRRSPTRWTRRRSRSSSRGR
jgi:hypothetical protein